MSKPKTKAVQSGTTVRSFISCPKGETARIQLGDGGARAVHVVIVTAGGTEIVVPAVILGELRVTRGLDLVQPEIRIHVESDTPSLRIAEAGAVHSLQAEGFKPSAPGHNRTRAAGRRARKANA